MKVLIWVHRDEVISGNITKYYFYSPQQTDWEKYVQVIVDRDKFARLEDSRFDRVARLEDGKDKENLFKDEETLIFERNPDSGVIRTRKVGDYGDENNLDINEDVPFGD